MVSGNTIVVLLTLQKGEIYNNMVVSALGHFLAIVTSLKWLVYFLTHHGMVWPFDVLHLKISCLTDFRGQEQKTTLNDLTAMVIEVAMGNHSFVP